MLLHPDITQQLPADVRTIAELLRAAGYVSACIGKWHLGGKGALPTDRGFDLYHPGKALTEPSMTEGGKGEYDLTIAAEKFIDANKDKSFFLYLAHNNPHVQLVAKQQLIEKHKDAFNPVYAAMIETLDDCVGRVVAKFPRSTGWRRTRSSSSFPTTAGCTSWKPGARRLPITDPSAPGKGFSCYEGGSARLPMIVRLDGPQIKGDQTSEVPVISTDWTPTLLASLAGVGNRQRSLTASMSRTCYCRVGRRRSVPCTGINRTI